MALGTLTRRAALAAAGAVAGSAATVPLVPRLPVLDGLVPPVPAVSETLNDASGLSATPVHRHLTLPQDREATLIAALRDALDSARSDGRPVSIGAARHSMGGQAIPREGHAITLAGAVIDIDTGSQTCRVLAGARWSQVIAALDPAGLSPAVMQSNHDFGVAATFSVNAHGWPVPFGPMGATVREIDMLLADGSLLTCSRTQNADIFAHAMGGYGLTGLIVALTLDCVPNQRLEPQYEALPAEDFARSFMAAVGDPSVSMAYGRLNVDRARLFRDALLVTYRPAADQTGLPPASGSGFVSRAASRLYRGQPGNEPMKRLRWGIETGIGAWAGSGPATRNSLMNEPVATLDDRDPDRTDILHEYFVEPHRFGDFLDLCRQIIPESYQEVLNVTLRFVDADPVAMLAFAPVRRIAAVMSFTQEMTARAEADMARMTRALIDGVIAIGGSYYLPYRPHATIAQLVAGYPAAPAFAAMKRKIDPALILRNALWDTYMDQL
jgi:FAD/FMN-containing dehydrogenase